MILDRVAKVRKFRLSENRKKIFFVEREKFIQ